MNKIGQWHKTKKELPSPNKTVLLDLGNSRYIVSRLYKVDNKGITFMTDSINDAEPSDSKDIKRWAYIKLDKYT